MRITGGSLCGRTVSAPRGESTRPTQERVRESVFNALAPVIAGSRFLELYAGSGAVGIEAYSRGAEEVWWVEAASRAAEALKKNVRALCGEGGGRIVEREVVAFLQRHPLPRPFDIVFADPPYAGSEPTRQDRGSRGARGVESEREGLPARVMALLRGRGWLREGGILLFETAARDPVQPGPGWQALRERAYGRTKVNWLVLRDATTPAEGEL